MGVSLADRLTDVMLGMTRPQADWFEALYVAALDTVGDPHAAIERAKVAWLDNPAPSMRQPIDLAYDVGRRSLDLAEVEPSDASATLLAIIQAIIEAKESGDEDSLEDIIDQIMGHADDSVDLAWTSQQTKTGKVKAVGSAEHAGRVLYGDAALRALQKQEAKQDPNNASKQAAHKPKGKRALSAEAAEAAGTLSREIIAAGRATPEQVEQLAQHLPSLTVDQLKGLAKVMGEKVGVRKAEIAERLLAKAKASLQAAGDGEQVSAVEAPAATAQPLGRLGDLMSKGHDKLTDDERQEAVTHAKSLLPFLQSLGVIPGDTVPKTETTPLAQMANRADGKPDPASITQVKKLIALRDRGVISDDELKAKALEFGVTGDHIDWETGQVKASPTPTKQADAVKGATSTDPGEYTGDPTLIVPHAKHEQRRREALPPAKPDEIGAALAAVQQHAEENPLLGGLGKYPEAYDAVKDSGVFQSPQHFMRAISDAIDQGLLEFRANNDPGFEQRNRPDLGAFAVPHRTDDLAGVSTWGRLTPQGAAMARKTK